MATSLDGGLGMPLTPPLAGLRVLDIATLLAAPSAATYLGEFGADVIKVEMPHTGDHQRHFGNVVNGKALTWASLGRNKRSMTLDLRKAAGAALFKQLARTADVVVENFRPGTLERWGLGPEVLLAENPALIVLRVTGFGQEGPYSGRPGFGTLAEAMSGFAHLVGEPGGPPTLPPFPLADGIAGLTGAYAIMIAVRGRVLNGGRGQVIDISLFEPILRLMEPFLLDYDQLGTAGRRMGNRSDHIAPRNAYRCADGCWIALSASAQSIFARLMDAIGKPELAQDERFSHSPARIVNAVELDGIIGDWFAEHSSSDAMAIMAKHSVSVGLVYDIPAIFDDPHVQARQSIVEVLDDRLGPLRMSNVVPRFSDTPGFISWTGAELGEHTMEIVKELGVTDVEIEELRRDDVV
jgi:crotonobetainyl-CoA:carnitine CoA-transferase CaiB-like acyl-CoA transferase